MTNSRTDYHKAIRKLLLERRLTQRSLAKQLGIHYVYLSKILSGQRAGYRIKIRLVQEFDFPVWILGTANHQRKAA